MGGGVCIWNGCMAASSFSFGAEMDFCRAPDAASGLGDDDSCLDGSTGGSGKVWLLVKWLTWNVGSLGVKGLLGILDGRWTRVNWCSDGDCEGVSWTLI